MKKTTRVTSYIAGILFLITLTSSVWAADPNAVATPAFAPDGGIYYTLQNVLITCTTASATIRYTLDGSDPNNGSIYDPNFPVVIDHSLILKAKALKASMTPSAVKSAAYTLVVSTPIFTPDGGTYNTEPNVLITCATPGATIRYTIDGSDPNEGTLIENGSSIVVAVDPPTILRAKAFKTGWNSSNIESEAYRQTGWPIFVNIHATGANNGLRWEDAYTNLQSALDAAVSGDEIWVAAGTYVPSVTVGGTGPSYRTFQLKNGVALYGGFAGTETSRQQRNYMANTTFLSGAGSCYHVFYHPTGSNLNNTAILDGFTVCDGFNTYSDGDSGIIGDGHGAGMHNTNSSPSIRNCIFQNNTVIGNLFDFAGGWMPCGEGGGMYNLESNPVLINCVFMNNTSNSDGGGIYNYQSNPVVINCVFINNTTNGWYGGGGIYNAQSNPVLINCTFTGNETYGIVNADYSNPTITNCIFWGNVGEQIYNEYDNGTPVVTYSDIQGGYSGTGNINADPLFVNANDPNEDILLSLQAGSPCIDAGNSSAVPPETMTDLAGNPRFTDDPYQEDTGSGTPPIVDMGAYENKKGVLKPVFTINNSNSLSGLSAIIYCGTPEAIIHYTTNGLDPTESDLIISSGSQVPVFHGLVLKAAAWRDGFTTSPVTSALFQLVTTKANLLSVSSTDTNGKYFILTADIDMAGETFSRAIIAPDIEPGNNMGFQGNVFMGIFDGNGHKIIHLNINSSAEYLGLFGYIGSCGMVKNLSIVNASITSGDYLGGLAGVNNGIIDNCSFNGTINGWEDVGGLVGYNSGTLWDCSSDGTVHSTRRVGGLTGASYYGFIKRCCSTASVEGHEYDIGGLVGVNLYTSIDQCYSMGSVVGNSTVSSVTDVGGLLGSTHRSIIKNCFSNGTVTVSSFDGRIIGGFAGSSYNDNIINCFWDTQTSGRGNAVGSGSSGGITGKTTAQMKTLSTFTSAGWDFTNETANGTNDIWRMCADGVSYPRFNWESIEGDFACPDGVNTEDLNYFVGKWLLNNCTSPNNYCGGVDTDTSGKVDLEDWAIFAGWWLEGI